MVVKMFIEPRLENVFSNNSYGYCPTKHTYQALASVRKNCWKTDWVIDLDIKGFFDNHEHQNQKEGVGVFLGFDCAISISSRKWYKRYKTSIRKAFKWLETIREQFPYLFYHWHYSFTN